MDTSLSGRVEPEVADSPGSAPSGARRAWWVWAVPFAAVAGMLIACNRFLFGTPLHEDADPGANSILIEQARHFTLLVGNYSREGFNHPGPAFLYVQSWGESLFWSGLHIVPTAWNGQLIAVYLLNALFAALVTGTVYGWTRSVRGAAAALAVVLLLGVAHPAVLNNDWMPYLYVPAYLAFGVAITSVAAGRTGDLWIAAVAGWFCVHGHACFLLFVPFLTCCAIVALAWPRRRRLGAALKSFLAARRRDWLPAAAISVLFLVPVAGELILHWPGNFAGYAGYGSSSHAGGHGLAQDARYVLWFWWPHAHAWLAVVALYAASAAAAWRCPRGPVRRFCWFLIAFETLSAFLLFVYAVVGVDEIGEHYIEYFAWTAPTVLILVVALAAVTAVPSIAAWKAAATTVTTVALAAVVAAGAAYTASAQARTSTGPDRLPYPARPAAGLDTDPALPAGVARLARLAGGRPVVLDLGHQAWPEMTGLLVQAERTGVTACLADARWTFMVTRQFICTSRERHAGRDFRITPGSAVRRGAEVVLRLRRAVVVAGP